MTLPWKGVLAVAGGFIIQLTLGTTCTDGNIGPYLVSYIRLHGDPSATLAYITWITAAHMGCEPILMIPGGLLEKRFGARLPALAGSLVVSLGVAVTYLTIEKTFGVIILTYGLMVGLGVGMAYIATLTCGIKWFPKHRGFVSGIIVAGMELGGCIFNEVQTSFINPSNLKTDSDGYFTQSSILDKFPKVFLLMGGVYVAMQLVATVMLINAPPGMEEEEQRDSDLSPKQVLQRKSFYILWFTMLFNIMVVTFFNSMYKAFGQTFINDDHYLAFLGSIASAFNAFARVGWGFLIDKFGYKRTMMSSCAAVSFFLFSMPAAPHGYKIMYTIWTIGLHVTMSGSYALMPSVTASTYGTKHVALNYGLVFSNCMVAAPLTAGITQALLDSFGYNGMFFLLGGMSCISMFLAFIFNDGSSDSTPTAVSLKKDSIGVVNDAMVLETSYKSSSDDVSINQDEDLKVYRHAVQ